MALQKNAGVGDPSIDRHTIKRDCAVCCLLCLSSCNEDDRTRRKDDGRFHDRSSHRCERGSSFPPYGNPCMGDKDASQQAA